MLKCKTVYPLFEDIIIKTIVLIQQRIEFRNISKSEIIFLDKIINNLEFLIEKFETKPAISNVNIESIVNELYKADPYMHGVILKIEFVNIPDYSRFGSLKINISK